MWELVRKNQQKTIFLMILLGGFLVFLGALASSYFNGNITDGVVVAVILWGIHFFCSFYMGDSLFLNSNRAEKITDSSLSPTLWNVTEEMAIASGMAKTPNIYIIDDHAPNAFAVGRNPENSSIAVTAGLLKLCNRDELQGVVAHELAHINNRDSLYMVMAASMISIISFITSLLRSSANQRSYSRTYQHSSQGNAAGMVLLIIPAIIISMFTSLIYYSISRKREYLADATGAIYTRYPEGLASALEKISTHHKPVVSADRASAPLYIVNPLKGNLSGSFSTHPPVENRIKILRSIGTSMDYAAYNTAYKNVMQTNHNLLSKKTLAQDLPSQERPPLPQTEPSNTILSRHREATDTLWKLHDYQFIHCTCDTTLKIPAQYKGRTISCPHCHKSYTIEL